MAALDWVEEQEERGVKGASERRRRRVSLSPPQVEAEVQFFQVMCV